MLKISFIFNEGRKKRLESVEKIPGEFFYSYLNFKYEFDEYVDYVEISSISNFMLRNFFKVIRKYSNIPIYTDKLLNKKTIVKIYNSDIIIATNQNLGFTIMPLIFFKKILRKTKVYIFTMGLIEIKSKNWLNKYLINKLINITCVFLFISKNELEAFKNIYSTSKAKFIYVPFCVDSEFWKSNKNLQTKKILFIGNDSNRDYDFLLKLAKKLPNLQFTFLTNHFNSTNLKNVTLLRGSWKENSITDNDVKKLYESHFITILPLHNSMQPSGQSVALQSMSMGNPVIISKTDGFWDDELFKHNKNILLLNKNNINLWVSKINRLYSDDIFYKYISKNARELIETEFNLNVLYKHMKKIVL